MNFSESTVLERVVPEGRAPGTKANFEPHATPAPRLRLDTRRSRWSLKRPLIAAAALLFLAVAAGYGDYYSTTGRFLVSTDDAYVQAHSVLVSPKVAGYISEVSVDDNQAVRAGQTLARIDNRDYLTALAAARANVDAAQAAIDNLARRIAQQRLAIVEAQAAVTTDRAALAFSQRQYGRYSDLARTGAATVQDSQQWQADQRKKEAALARDSAAVGVAQQQVDVLGSQLSQAKATLAQQ